MNHEKGLRMLREIMEFNEKDLIKVSSDMEEMGKESNNEERN